MRHSNRGPFRAQVNLLRRQFLQDGELPFTDVLTEEVLAQALAALTGWLDRIFSPLVTLWVFLGQVLSADHSCRAAVARLLAHRLARGQAPCSPRTGAYCQARQRLPEPFFADVVRSVGRALDEQAQRRWPWQGRRVYLFDGMPDMAAVFKPGKKAKEVRFDLNDPRELQVRSALAYAASFKCPARLYYSHQAWEHMHRTSQRTTEVAQERGLDIEAILVEGNHFSMVQPAMKQSIEFFGAKAPAK